MYYNIYIYIYIANAIAIVIAIPLAIAFAIAITKGKANGGAEAKVTAKAKAKAKPTLMLQIRHGGGKITCYILHIDCLLNALDAHMFSHDGYGPATKAQGPKAGGPPGPGPALLGLGPWSRAHIHHG